MHLDKSTKPCNIRIKLSFDSPYSSEHSPCWFLTGKFKLRKVCDLEHIIRKRYDLRETIDLWLDGFHLPHQEDIAVVRDGDAVRISRCKHGDVAEEASADGDLPMDVKEAREGRKGHKKHKGTTDDQELSSETDASNKPPPVQVNDTQEKHEHLHTAVKKKRKRKSKINDETEEVVSKKTKTVAEKQDDKKISNKNERQNIKKKEKKNVQNKGKVSEGASSTKKGDNLDIVSSNLQKKKRPSNLEKMSFAIQSNPLVTSTPNPVKGNDNMMWTSLSSSKSDLQSSIKSKPVKLGSTKHVRFNDSSSEEEEYNCTITETKEVKRSVTMPSNLQQQEMGKEKNCELLASALPSVFNSPVMARCRQMKSFMPKKQARKDIITNTSTLIINRGNGKFCLVEKKADAGLINRAD